MEGGTVGEYLTSSQAARLLGVSRSTFLNWQASGKLAEHGVHPIQTLGGQYRYRREEIEELLRALTSNGGQHARRAGTNGASEGDPDVGNGASAGV